MVFWKLHEIGTFSNIDWILNLSILVCCFNFLSKLFLYFWRGYQGLSMVFWKLCEVMELFSMTADWTFDLSTLLCWFNFLSKLWFVIFIFLEKLSTIVDGFLKLHEIGTFSNIDWILNLSILVCCFNFLSKLFLYFWRGYQGLPLLFPEIEPGWETFFDGCRLNIPSFDFALLFQFFIETMIRDFYIFGEFIKDCRWFFGNCMRLELFPI